METGCYLGDMTNELEDYHKDAYISEFVSGGPKNYGYRVKTPEKEHIVLKVKGFTLNRATTKILHYEAMKEMVHKYVKGEVEKREIKSNDIQRNDDYEITTAATVKRYQIVYTKRTLSSDFTTLPFGYRLS